MPRLHDPRAGRAAELRLETTVTTRRIMVRRPAAVLTTAVCILLAATLGTPHDINRATAVVIDTDMGVDDAVALTLALQDPRLDIAAIVACEGVASPSAAVQTAERMLELFNRSEIPLYASELESSRPAPECRVRAESMLGASLPETSTSLRRSFVPTAYESDGGHITVLAIGPLSQLVSALEERPELSTTIARIVIAGDPADLQSWNLARDPKAVKILRRSGILLQFVAPRGMAAKPAVWHADPNAQWRTTSLGDQFLDRLMATPDAREHYLVTLDQLHDELAMLYVLEPQLFEASGSGDVFFPRPDVDVGGRVAELIHRGRQRKLRVVLADRPLPDAMLQPDVRARRADILAANGSDEWFAQLLLNELHEHLGAYSIIGVKMALRAAELLNAPPHAMAILSHAPPSQPVSCLNDGLLVATGSTPGRNLFRHEPGPPGTIEASFAYNDRQVSLSLKEEYRNQIRARIEGLLQQFSLSDDGYWAGVRELGLDIWEDWHRLDLFDVAPTDERDVDADTKE